MAKDRPIITLKLATSLDARIATVTGASQWITGPESRAEVHRMHSTHDAVLTGIGTVLADDPELTARLDPPPARQPWRVVLDRDGRLPPASKLVQTTDKAGLIWCTGGPVPAERLTKLTEVKHHLLGRSQAGTVGVELTHYFPLYTSTLHVAAFRFQSQPFHCREDAALDRFHAVGERGYCSTY